MYRTHIVFASLVAAIASASSDEIPSNGDNHTDAWRTVSIPDPYFLVYRSYEYDAGSGGTGKCVSVQLCDKNDTTRTARSRFMYRDAKTTQLIGVTARVTVARSWNSSVDDIIRVGDADNCDAPANAVTSQIRLVYSDYSTCDVLVVFGTLEPKCELWVKDGYQKHLQGTIETKSEGTNDGKDNITKCEEQYNNLCKVKYQIYDRDICSSAMNGGSKDPKKITNQWT
uniref:Putative salivary lipocalin n=1 Tax=Ixodes ricinus TaxID=34613 RepID=A0A0K8R7M1_IXORI